MIDRKVRCMNEILQLLQTDTDKLVNKELIQQIAEKHNIIVKK